VETVEKYQGELCAYQEFQTVVMETNTWEPIEPSTNYWSTQAMVPLYCEHDAVFRSSPSVGVNGYPGGELGL